jgi:hypothetical protein
MAGLVPAIPIGGAGRRPPKRDARRKRGHDESVLSFGRVNAGMGAPDFASVHPGYACFGWDGEDAIDLDLRIYHG